MKHVFLTNDLKLVDKYTGTYVEVVKENTGNNTVEVKFFDDSVATVERGDLYDPDKVPFKVGDKVKNLEGFTLNSGARAWAGITWEVKRVSYSLPNMRVAVLVCDSYEVAVFNKVFMSTMVEKI